MRSRRHARECVLQALYMCDALEEYDEQLIEVFLERFASEQLDENSRQEHLDFFHLLTRGVLESLTEIGHSLTRASHNWEVSRMARVDRNILRLSAYEILFLPDIPQSVSINEAIEIAKRFGSDDSPNFINGVLDKLARLAHDGELKIAVGE